ncbi:DUF1840 domain-containing protein [Alcaligenes sp. SDU_A2]|uniref:DUF1840 domain-containing protein n=1 Tax=Alcaligenes sp. SDU_A2 TaxID=3136634 RepID=UPI00311EAC04
MLVVFKSKAAANVLMFVEHAMPILRAAGRSYPDGLPERGVFTAEQLPSAIKGIEHAVGQDRENEQSPHEDEDREPDHPISQAVSFKQRAFPLLDMMREANKSGDPVLWEPADRSW